MSAAAKAKVRCAIYTRKSTDEGLDQEFNSLDAQREAGESYVRSQAGEGWRVLPEYYDDGGFSGGNLDRPAMQRLLADVDAGKVDVIVVYKVDRLTRSLMDFARIVERFDVRGVSFVSVTQAFNTTTSMGRLTLNVLLSFAQFEREVTGERIRDKIAASKAKGIWMGGNVPLGYDLGDRQLLVNPVEAEQVRHIFERYVALGSGVVLAHELRREGILSKRWTSRNGRTRGDQPFSCGALYYLLQNRLYLGDIVHKGLRHAGTHEAIVSEQLFEAVQEALAANRQRRREQSMRPARFHLVGLVCDANGEQMTTSFSYGRGGKQYRYYVSGSLDPSRTSKSKSPMRVPAAALERLVIQSVARLLQREVTFADALPSIRSIELRSRSIQIVFASDMLLEPSEPVISAVERLEPLVAPARLCADSDRIRLIVDRQPVFRGGRASGAELTSATCTALDVRTLLRSAHMLLEAHAMSPVDATAHGRATAPPWRRQRRTMALGLLAPQLQKAILQGGFRGSVEQLMSAAPLAWTDQVKASGCE